MKKILVLIILVSFIGCNSEKEKTPKKFHERYKKTPVYSASLAVDDDDDIKLLELLKDKPDSIVNYKDPYVQSTLLFYAVQKQKYNATRALLDLGADPNIICSNGSYTPFIMACGIPKNNEFALLLLNNGGDVNTKIETKKPCHNRTPLIAAAKYNFGVVKSLVKSGADVNYCYEGPFFIINVLNEAVKFRQIYIVEYLLMNTDVDCTIPSYIKKDDSLNIIKKGTVLEALKRMRLPKDSIKQKEALKRVIKIVESRTKLKEEL